METAELVELEIFTDDRTGKVTEPEYFGASELVAITMSLKSIKLSFDQYDDVGPFLDHLVVEMPSFIQFESDHLQNVVEAVHVIPDQDFDLVEDFRSFDGRKMLPPHFKGRAAFYIFVTPKTGVELFIAGENVRLFRERKASDDDEADYFNNLRDKTPAVPPDFG